MSVNLDYKKTSEWLKPLAAILALVLLSFCPAAFAATAGGQVTLSPSYKATFAASSAFFTPAASATDIGVINGSASKKVIPLKILLNYKATAAGVTDIENFTVVKRSTANSGGTATTLTNVPLDSANTATAVAKNYTANPTLGTTVGTIANGQVAGGNVTGQFGTITLWEAPLNAGGCVLTGTAQGLAINHNGVTVAGSSPLVQFTYIWTEEP